jgi:hypothetical protein
MDQALTEFRHAAARENRGPGDSSAGIRPTCSNRRSSTGADVDGRAAACERLPRLWASPSRCSPAGRRRPRCSRHCFPVLMLVTRRCRLSEVCWSSSVRGSTRVGFLRIPFVVTCKQRHFWTRISAVETFARWLRAAPPIYGPVSLGSSNGGPKRRTLSVGRYWPACKHGERTCRTHRLFQSS